jgi:hypothetical protein
MAIQMRRIREIWQRLTATRYTQALEAQLARLHAENVRLREENRALLNSILGIAGIPPVSVATQNASALGTTNSAENPRNYPSPQSGPEAPAFGPVSPSNSTDRQTQAQSHAETQSQPRARANPPARRKNLAQVAPMRRRSWQQINRTLEFEAARNKAGRDADAIDAQ